MRIVKLTGETKKNILEDLLKRSPSHYGEYEATVNGIIEQVRARGDQAVFDYTKQFDKCELTAENLVVTRAEIEEAYRALDEELIGTMKRSAENIRVYHEKQVRQSFFATKPDGSSGCISSISWCPPGPS